MATIKFDYDTWDDKKDLLLHRPGNGLGFTAILTSMPIGDMSSVRNRKSDTLIRETEEGVIGLITGGLEWLRKRGYSAEAVQSKVRAYKIGNNDRRNQIAMRNTFVLQAMSEISNPKDRKLAESVVIG